MCQICWSQPILIILIFLQFLPLETNKHCCSDEFIGGRRSLLQFSLQRFLFYSCKRQGGMEETLLAIFIIKSSSFCVVFHNSTSIPKPRRERVKISGSLLSEATKVPTCSLIWWARLCLQGTRHGMRHKAQCDLRVILLLKYYRNLTVPRYCSIPMRF